MAYSTYEIPSDLKELFSNGEASYKIVDYSENMEMDNFQSMVFFIESVGIKQENIVDDYGTQIIIQHPEYEIKLCIDSGGLGDFYSHGFDVTIYIE